MNCDGKIQIMRQSKREIFPTKVRLQPLDISNIDACNIILTVFPIIC
jgi:hypothetical protein